MSAATKLPDGAPPKSRPPPVGPSVEAWRSLSPHARERFLDRVAAALTEEALRSPEARPHRSSRDRAHDALSRWFTQSGRPVYLGVHEIVQYPGSRGCCPDLFAVVGVPDPGPEADRRAWVVADEGRGIDLVLEVLHSGDRKKDLFDNVLFYAELGIPEYFVYDRRKQRLHGHRLPPGAGHRYEPIPMFGGELYSQVLGLSLTISGEKLRFRAGGAELPETMELLQRANAALDRQEQRALEEARRAEDEARRADEATRLAAEANRRADEEAVARRAETQRADEEAAARRVAEARLAELLARLGES